MTLTQVKYELWESIAVWSCYQLLPFDIFRLFFFFSSCHFMWFSPILFSICMFVCFSHFFHFPLDPLGYSYTSKCSFPTVVIIFWYHPYFFVFYYLLISCLVVIGFKDPMKSKWEFYGFKSLSVMRSAICYCTRKSLLN